MAEEIVADLVTAATTAGIDVAGTDAMTTSASPDLVPHFSSSGNFTPINPPSKCNYYIKNNTVVVFNFANSYGGIPQNLLFNLIGWILLVGLFAVLRRAAGNFGRLALVRKDDDESKWTQLFFAPDDSSAAAAATDLGDGLGAAVVEDVLVTEPAAVDHHESMASIDYTEVDNGFCSWIASIFTLSDDKFMRKCGVDAVQYLKFQRHLIVFVTIMTVVCIGIILPVNFQVCSFIIGRKFPEAPS